jgi:hypothetical protein
MLREREAFAESKSLPRAKARGFLANLYCRRPQKAFPPLGISLFLCDPVSLW